MTALIDVIIPVFNGAAYLREAIDSIQAQTVSDIKIIIVDDGSTDQTPAILASIAAQDSRVEVLTTPNQGIVDALNLALSHCTADYVARHDGDDLAYPERFRLQLAYFADHPSCVAQSGAVRHIDEWGDPTGGFGKGTKLERVDPRFIPAEEPYLIHPFLMLRRSAAQQVGGYRYVLNSEDTDLYWRLKEIGDLHNLPEVLGDYRLHSGSISGSSLSNGRVMAVSSQLSALSYVRRQEGKPDLEFEKSDYRGLKENAKSLQSLYELVAPRLDASERAHFKMAVSAKVLELTGYRPYEVVAEDCGFLKASALESLNYAKPHNKAFLIRRYSGTAARLLYKRLYPEAAALLWPSLLPPTIYRLALRYLFPPTLRESVKKLAWPRIRRVKALLQRKPNTSLASRATG